MCPCAPRQPPWVPVSISGCNPECTTIITNTTKTIIRRVGIVGFGVFFMHAIVDDNHSHHDGDGNGDGDDDDDDDENNNKKKKIMIGRKNSSNNKNSNK